VPQVEGGLPGMGVTVQQMTRLRTMKNPLTASINMITQKIS
jgi:hypothetical protein